MANQALVKDALDMEPPRGDGTSPLNRQASGGGDAAVQFVLPDHGTVRLILAFLLLTLVNAAQVLFAQITVSTGSIVGMVTDPSEAVVIGAKVTILST